MLLKGIIILSLAFYVFYKISSFFFKAGAASRQFHKQQPNKQFNPDDTKSKPGNGGVKGGEYVDYEEVK
jgi:hypothetical protein